MDATYDTAPSSTRTFHQGNLDRHILPVLGRRPLADVTPTEISRMLNGVRESVSTASADAVYRTCSALFHAAVADDVTLRSPVRSKKHRPRRQVEPPVVLERPQARAMLLQLGGWQRDTGLLQLALGARIGEIAGLTPHDIDLERGTGHDSPPLLPGLDPGHQEPPPARPRAALRRHTHPRTAHPRGRRRRAHPPARGPRARRGTVPAPLADPDLDGSTAERLRVRQGAA